MVYTWSVPVGKSKRAAMIDGDDKVIHAGKADGDDRVVYTWSLPDDQ